MVHNFTPEMPLRVSALRGLGAFKNGFAIESFMDDLAKEAGADPLEFRIRHLQDPRARDVVALAAERFGWAQAAKRPLWGRATVPSRPLHMPRRFLPDRARPEMRSLHACV